MGIPKFFRWMNDRYPGLLVTAKEDDIPAIDNFYLDMNGIIHNCSHPCDGDVHFRLSEGEMFEDIFKYIDTLFKIINPRQIMFMAVDGVAPRAKMNQQRGRRFRSAKEACDREEAAIKKGDILPSEERFDSNCITPGTSFMVKLNTALKQFIHMKLSTDPKWQRVKIILSGHETPGEGEHKVMDFIRYQRSQDDYNPKTSHCLYGLDTDLVMLGLSSHEPNFILLREEVKFNNKKNTNVKARSQRVDSSKVNFNVLYLNILRDSIQNDFKHLEPYLTFKFDLECIIDDWILICFLVGNDFIPHIPHFHIHKNALPKIIDVYQSTLKDLDGYLNVKGILNLTRFRLFAKALAVVDFENYRSLLKENGGECAKDDFSKLNMFVRHRARVVGIRDNGGHHRSYNRRPENPSHHSHNHQPEVWYNIKGTRSNQSNYTPNRSTHSSHSNNNNNNNNNNNSSSRQPTNNNRPRNGPSGTGVHSFTEEQINNSIVICADGDPIDVSDDEFTSGEKFLNDRSRHNRFTRQQPLPPRSNNKPGRSRYEQPPGGRALVNDADSFKAYKRTYYKEKLNLSADPEEVLKVVHEYVRALQWNLHYYYHGCVSWGWFYPYHYAPFISDVKNFKFVDMAFDMGVPFKPFDQLLSVLPAASSGLLPKVYRSLVTAESSPLAKFFPSEVEYDLNGKQNDWEAVVLAPFIEEESLLKASVLCNLFLTQDERRNNDHGPHLLFQHVKGRGPGSVKCVAIDVNGFHVPRDKIKYGLLLTVKRPAA